MEDRHVRSCKPSRAISGPHGASCKVADVSFWMQEICIRIPGLTVITVACSGLAHEIRTLMFSIIQERHCNSRIDSIYQGTPVLSTSCLRRLLVLLVCAAMSSWQCWRPPLQAKQMRWAGGAVVRASLCQLMSTAS